MRKVGIRRLTPEAFAPYGSYASIMEPQGCHLGTPPVTFYRDMTQQYLGSTNTVSFSTCVVNEREWVIDCAEYHNYTCEAILVLDGDYLMHVAPAMPEGGDPADEIEVFLIPKGTMMVTRPGVWHQAGFPYRCKAVHILCCLPERAYVNDCVVVNIPEEKKIQVVDEFIG